MSTLAETQALFRNAVVTGDVAGVAPLLEASRQRRLSIHRRNYQSSLVHALLGKFPALAWLTGTPFLTEAANAFVEQHPPDRPCIAEYGETFPKFLSTLPGADWTPYLGAFAMLEWHIGHITIAVAEQFLTLEQISSVDPEALAETRLSLQRGARYLRAPWPVDELMKLYLSDGAPDNLVFDPANVFLEIRGSRGEFDISRLQEAEFLFRESLVQGLPIADAAEQAMDSDASFDAGASLVRLAAEGLVIGIGDRSKGDDL